MVEDYPIFLVGPMGSGKTAVGQRLAALLARDFVDTDREVEARCGVDIAYIFEKEEEAGFRKREHQVLADFAHRDRLVIATGGGIVTQSENRQIMRDSGIVIFLETSVDQQYERTRYSSTRPLLEGDDPREKLRKLLAVRGPLYAGLANFTCNTDGQRVNQVASQICAQLKTANFKKKAHNMKPLTVELGARSYPIYIGAGLIGNTGLWRELVEVAALPGKLLIVTDRNVAAHYLAPLRATLADHQVETCFLETGEAHKNLAATTKILDQLITDGFQRDAAIIALGGGVVGDIAGFAAACFMRGIRFVQVPTTLLAQVDSSVGGKTGVNHTHGKNLIGAFHQPRAVIIDTNTLTTLPSREVRAGLAEVIKYGCIYDIEFFAWLEAQMPALLALDQIALAQAIRRSCEIKAAIVARDEREKGERALLNFGHSFGHAIEQVTGYSRWLHGEAVAIGMLMACELSKEMGYLSAAEAVRVADLLAAAGLPNRTTNASVEALIGAMKMDKKNTTAEQRLVLLNGLGASQVRNDCSATAIRQALTAYTDA